MRDKVLGRPVVQAGGVDSNRVDLSLHEQLCGFFGNPGKVQSTDVAGLVGPEVFLAVRPALSPPGTHEHDRTFRNLAETLFPGGYILRGEAVVWVRFAISGDVDEHSGR